MAELIIGPACPQCSGCGARMHVLPWSLDSRVREAYDPTRRPSSAREVGVFAAAHAACSLPRVTVTLGGVRITDRRRVWCV